MYGRNHSRISLAVVLHDCRKRYAEPSFSIVRTTVFTERTCTRHATLALVRLARRESGTVIAFLLVDEQHGSEQTVMDTKP
uniref:Transposase n=1 Tax=Ascaris lumbricoides TaxID=6252 RepID=A0A0M3HUU5_ASCLU